MSARLAIYVLLPLIVVAAFSTFFYFVNRPAFLQESNQVVIREPGERLLGPPQPAAPEARKDLEFAWLSQAAYQRQPGSKKNQIANCVDADSALRNSGWSRWTDFPDAGLSEKFENSHLRVEVWTNEQRKALAVAFGGTEFSDRRDWKSNLRWFLPSRASDEYGQIVKELGPAFIADFVRRRQDPRWGFLNHASIFATGHSLGGGLAQEFAYALPIDANVPRVSKVFAFDPSPVTGFTGVDVTTRNNNKHSLDIDRIYERGEILALLRSITNFFHPPSAVNPTIRQVRYNLFSRMPLTGHSISELACKLEQVSR